MNIVLKMSEYIFPLITLPYVTRTLGVLNNGKISFAASVIAYFSMFAQLGIPMYGIRECAKCRDDQNKLTQTVQELLIINTCSVILSFIALTVCLLSIEKFHSERVLMTINSMTIILNMIGMEWLYQALEQYQYITVRNIVFKIISIVMLFLLVHCQEDYVIYTAISIFSSGGSSILNLWNTRKILARKTYFGLYDLKRHLQPVFTFFALSVAVSIYTSMDTVMLGFLSSNEEVAYYALATKLKMILATTIAALGPVLLPRISYCLAHQKREEFLSYIEKSLHFVILLAFPVTIFFFTMASQVVDILGGAEYVPAVKCVKVITTAVLPLGVGNIACQQILAPMGKEKLTMYSTILGALINIMINLLLIPEYGAVGAAVATVLAEGIIACVQIKFCWIEMRKAFRKLPIMEIIITNGLATIFLVELSKNIREINSFFQICIAGLFFGAVYGMVLFLFKDPLIMNVIPKKKKT